MAILDQRIGRAREKKGFSSHEVIRKIIGEMIRKPAYLFTNAPDPEVFRRDNEEILKYLDCDKKIEDKKIAATIMPMLDTSNPFWEKSATRYLTMLIAYVMESLPEEEHSMISVVDLHSSGTSVVDSMLGEFACLHKESLAARLYFQITATYNADRMRASIAEFVNEALEPFNYREFRRIFAGSKEECFDIARLGQEKTILFLNTSDSDYSFGVLSDLFNAQALNILIESADKQEDGRLSVPVRIMLDDFAASSKIQDFESIISIIRSRGISVSIILQSISQLNHRYDSARAATILNNCDHILYLGGHDLETAQLISNHINKPLNSVLCLPIDQAILISQGSSAKYVPKAVPYAKEYC